MPVQPPLPPADVPAHANRKVHLQAALPHLRALQARFSRNLLQISHKSSVGQNCQHPKPPETYLKTQDMCAYHRPVLLVFIH